jgi:formiminotetrahydrofolate cyclodeaminase
VKINAANLADKAFATEILGKATVLLQQALEKENEILAMVEKKI